jgi:hypothetical protein
VRKNEDEDAEVLCRAYRDRRKSPDPQVAARLAKLAGGTPKVDRFCAETLHDNEDQPSSDPQESPRSRPPMTPPNDPQDQPHTRVSPSE